MGSSVDEAEKGTVKACRTAALSQFSTNYAIVMCNFSCDLGVNEASSLVLVWFRAPFPLHVCVIGKFCWARVGGRPGVITR